VCVYSGWGGAPNGLGGLYRTTNRGSTWTRLTGSQFDRVTSITFNPQNSHQAYLTTETQGLWISGDMNSTLPSWALVSSYPFRQPHRVFFNPFALNEVWVTSFGNGMKTGDLNATGTRSIDGADGELFALFPNPAKDHIVIKYNGTNLPAGLHLSIVDMAGRTVMNSKLGSTLIIMGVEGLVPGTYVYRINRGSRTIKSGSIAIEQ
jgi:hypothetical protein